METQKIIWRDDDIAFTHTYHQTNVLTESDIYNKFIKIDSLFKKYGVTHTVAVIAKDIHKAKKLVKYIKENPHIDVQLHCWEHLHYPVNMDVFEEHLLQGIKRLTEVFGKIPTIFYPPYNDVISKMIDICNKHKIKLSYSKMCLEQYLNGYTREVINFHYWADECKDLETALIKYTNENN